MQGLDMISPNKVKEEDDLRIIFYLTGFHMLQIGINVPLYFFSLLPHSAHFTSMSNILIWTVSFSGDFILPILVTVFFQLLANFFLVKFWNLKKIAGPSRRQWFLSYTIFILIIVLVSILFSLISPNFRELFLWPWIGLFLSSLGLCGFLFGFSLTFLTVFALIFFPAGDYLLYYIIFVIFVTFALSSPVLFLYPGCACYYFFRLLEKNRIKYFFLLAAILFWIIFQILFLFFLLDSHCETFWLIKLLEKGTIRLI